MGSIDRRFSIVIIKDADRVAFVPKFTNSPNRDLPGLKYMKTKKG